MLCGIQPAGGGGARHKQAKERLLAAKTDAVPIDPWVRPGMKRRGKRKGTLDERANRGQTESRASEREGEK